MDYKKLNKIIFLITDFMFLRKISFLLSLFTFLLGLSNSSCVSYKNQIFFQGLSDTSYVASTKQPEPIIQRGDQLSIMVYTPDMAASNYYNMPMGGGQGGGLQMLNQAGQSGGGPIIG